LFLLFFVLSLCFISIDYTVWGFWVNLILVLATIALAIFAVVQALAAKESAKIAKEAAEETKKVVRLTERADVLLESAGIALSASQAFDGDARVVLRFKNFGRTRARDVSFRTRMIIPGVPDAFVPPLPFTVLGADQERSISFETFRDCLTKATFEDVAHGRIPLRFESWLVYTDVFGASHTTRDVGVFSPGTMTFRIEDHTAG
jgi:hypothetical protein